MKKNENSKKLVLKKMKISELNNLNIIVGGINSLDQIDGGASGATTGTNPVCISGRICSNRCQSNEGC